MPKRFSITEKTSDYQISIDDLISKRYIKQSEKKTPLALFSDIPFVLLSQNNDTRVRSDKLCRQAGFVPKIALELNQQATAYMTASTGLGAVFISDIIASKLALPDSLAYYLLDGDASRRTVYFYYKRHKFKSRAMQELINLIEESRE